MEVLHLDRKILTTLRWIRHVDGVSDEQCANISFLYLSNNNLTAIPGLERFVNLVKLECANNKITDIDDISTLFKLRVLVCRNNNLFQLPDCRKLGDLEVVAMGDNPYLCDELQVNYNRWNGDTIHEEEEIMVKIERWRQNTAKHYGIRQCIQGVVAVLGVSKRKRAIRDVLSLVGKAVWATRLDKRWFNKTL